MTYKQIVLTELQQLRKENEALNAVIDRLIYLNEKENNKNITRILSLFKTNDYLTNNPNAYLILNQVDRLLLDIEILIKHNYNFIQTIIINRKNVNCFGAYIKSQKEMDIGVGGSSTRALKDLKEKCLIFIRENKIKRA